MTRIQDVVDLVRDVHDHLEEVESALKAGQLAIADTKIYAARRDLGRALSLVRAEAYLRQLVAASLEDQALQRQKIKGAPR